MEEVQRRSLLPRHAATVRLDDLFGLFQRVTKAKSGHRANRLGDSRSVLEFPDLIWSIFLQPGNQVVPRHVRQAAPLKSKVFFLAEDRLCHRGGQMVQFLNGRPRLFDRIQLGFQGIKCLLFPE